MTPTEIEIWTQAYFTAVFGKKLFSDPAMAAIRAVEAFRRAERHLGCDGAAKENAAA